MMIVLNTRAELEDKVKELGILAPGERWETGGDHHPRSYEVYYAMSAIDMVFVNDHHCWKSGGDGDNGEAIMYELDMVFELEDKGYQVSREAWQ